MNAATIKKITLLTLSIFLLLLSIKEITTLYEKVPKDDSQILWTKAKLPECSPSMLYDVHILAKEDKAQVKDAKTIIIGGAIQDKIVTSGGAPTLRLILHANNEPQKMGMVAVDIPFNQKEKFMKLKVGDLVEVEGRLEINASYYDADKKDTVFVTMEEKQNDPNKEYFNRLIVKADKWI